VTQRVLLKVQENKDKRLLVKALLVMNSKLSTETKRVKVEVEMGEMVESRVANNPARVKTAVALAVRVHKVPPAPIQMHQGTMQPSQKEKEEGKGKRERQK